jgi:hypothetical protein
MLRLELWMPQYKQILGATVQTQILGATVQTQTLGATVQNSVAWSYLALWIVHPSLSLCCFLQ